MFFRPNFKFSSELENQNFVLGWNQNGSASQQAWGDEQWDGQGDDWNQEGWNENENAGEDGGWFDTADRSQTLTPDDEHQDQLQNPSFEG